MMAPKNKFFSILLALILTACQPDTTDTLTLPATFTLAPTLTSAPPEAAATITDSPDFDVTEAPPTQPPTATYPPPSPIVSSSPRGIILLIGDGMGPNQRLGATYLRYGQDGEQLLMDQMPVQGWQQTAAIDRLVTDSAAAATSMATGVKTRYGAIGVDKDNNDLTTILEHAQAQGWAVGLVTTVEMADATPAGFIAHVDGGREQTVAIARQMIEHDPEVLLGGGEDDFLPNSIRGCYNGWGHRTDERNLVSEALDTGYTYVCSGSDFAALDLNAVDKLLGLFADDEMLAPFSPNLADMTAVAIEILSRNPDGFFLMVEAGQIDRAGHVNDAEAILSNTMGLDDALAVAQAYATDFPNTLIIVTADHETGGMSLPLEEVASFRLDGPFEMPTGVQFWVDWEHRNHTDIDIPVSAQGPFSELLAGAYPNTWIFEVMYRMLTAGS